MRFRCSLLCREIASALKMHKHATTASSSSSIFEEKLNWKNTKLKYLKQLIQHEAKVETKVKSKQNKKKKQTVCACAIVKLLPKVTVF